jgi:hypothetical protein
MHELTLQLADGRDGYRPHERLRGTAGWQLTRTATAMEVRLCWFVEVQGVPEVRVVQTVRYDAPLAQEQRPFEFVLPAAPYSYAGALATLSWAIELVAIPEKEFVRVLFKLGPQADLVELWRQLE